MKNIILCTFFVAMCLLAEVKGSTGLFEGQCVGITHQSLKEISVVGCPSVAVECAPGKHMEYSEVDISKPFPECCSVPICKD